MSCSYFSFDHLNSALHDHEAMLPAERPGTSGTSL